MIIDKELNVEQVVSAYAAGQRRFQGIEIVALEKYARFQGINLSGAEFTDCWFDSTTFVNVNLRFTRFIGCNLKCTTFSHCDLRNSQWNDVAVCAIAFVECESAGIEASAPTAYGFVFENPTSFVEYASQNGRKLQPARAP